MSVIINETRPVFEIPGIRHRTLVGATDGLAGLEVWKQTVASGAATPVHYHVCEEVILIESGTGYAVVAGNTVPFGPGTTVIVPAMVVHQLVNDGDGQVALTAALSETPARAFTPNGDIIPLPWQPS